MKIIRTLADVDQLQQQHQIGTELAQHLKRKIAALRKVLEPDQSSQAFSLYDHGPFGILEPGDHSLTAIGLPESLAEIMPEWVSRLELEGEIYYILYIVTNNEQVIQIYLPDRIMAATIRTWLAEQPLEEEGGENRDDSTVPFD